MAKTLLIIGLGGFVGSICRYLIYYYAEQYAPPHFPWGTYIANMLGCLIIGLVLGLALNGDYFSRETVFFLSVGFCGSLTTFSTFAFENLLMLERGRVLVLILYTGLSFMVGLFLTWAGVSLARLIS